MDGSAIRNARESRGRLARLAKAKAEGTTDKQTWLDEMELDNTMQGFRGMGRDQSNLICVASFQQD